MEPTIDHGAFRAMAENGTIAVGVEPAIARRFFTDSAFAVQRALIGEPVFVECVIVRGAFYLAPGTLLASFWWAWTAFGWWSLLLASASVIIWFYYASMSSVGRAALWPLLVIIGALVYWNFARHPGPSVSWVTLVLVAMLLSRLTYRCASGLFRLLIIRNARAYHIFRDSAVFVRE